MRTTIDLDPSILRALKDRQRIEHKTLGALVSELLSPALATAPVSLPEFRWAAHDLRPRVDPEDTDAVWAALDETGRA
jgi:hypothetical protein